MTALRKQVPTITLEQLGDMLAGGDGSPDLKAWREHVEAAEPGGVEDPAPFRLIKAGTEQRACRVPTALGYYQCRKPLRCTVSDTACKSTVDLDGEVSQKVGAKLFNDYSSVLEPLCQMGYRRHGEAIMQGALHENANRPFAWPAVFASAAADAMKGFWQLPQGGANGLPYARALEECSIEPIRIMQVCSSYSKSYIPQSHPAVTPLPPPWCVTFCGTMTSSESRWSSNPTCA